MDQQAFLVPTVSQEVPGVQDLLGHKDHREHRDLVDLLALQGLLVFLVQRD